MKKFKELRFTIVIGLFATVFFILGLYFIIQGDVSRGVIGLIIGAIALILMLTRYNIMLDTTYLVSYEWKVLFMLPVIVQYKDINEFKAYSKHRITIRYKEHHITHLYVFDSASVLSAYTRYREELEKKVSNNEKDD